jgi:tellurite resistance protein
LAAVLFGAATCDGQLAAVEHEELLALAHRSRALKSLSTNELAEINTKIVARLRDEATALQGACTALPEEMRLPLFAHALDLVLADGELNQDEAEFLDSIVLYLGLDRESVERVSSVIALKNRF